MSRDQAPGPRRTPAHCNFLGSDAEARERLNDPAARAAGATPAAVRGTLGMLAAHLPPTSTVHVGLDAAARHRAIAVDDMDDYPLGRAFVLGDHGEIAHAGDEPPAYHRTFQELLAAGTAAAGTLQADSATLRCRICAQPIGSESDTSLARAGRDLQVHHEAAHGPLRWGVTLPAAILAALEEAGILTASAQRAYRDIRHRGGSHPEALEAAAEFSRDEADAMGLGRPEA